MSGSPGISKSLTGIAGFDELTLGGLPMGRPTLVCGSAGCGKTLFASTFLIHGARDQGEPGVFVTFEDRPDDIVANVASLGFALDELVNDGKIAIEHILIDPGFGFGKNVGHNLELMNGLALFHSLGCPLVVGASRKRTIGALSAEAPADKRLAGSIAFALKAVEQGAQVVRVHDVAETVQAIRIWRGMRDQALTPRL